MNKVENRSLTGSLEEGRARKLTAKGASGSATEWGAAGTMKKGSAWWVMSVVGAVGVLVTLVTGGCWDFGGGVETKEWDGGIPVCGDGQRGEQEICDGEELAGETCFSQGYEGGSLSCLSDCSGFDFSGCTGSGPVCGDGVVNGTESCDGTNLAGATCSSLGHGGGDLACSQDCAFDESGCHHSPCSNGVCDVEGGETIESCPEDCAWVQASGGHSHTCAVKADGSAWCWGLNNSGQLGNDTYQEQLSPMPVHALHDATAIAAGSVHTCAVTLGAEVWCWGSHLDGQLGVGGGSSSPVPTWVDLDSVQSVSLGQFHSCALREDGSVFCWEKNDQGQLGVGDLYDADTPQEVPISQVRDIAAGSDHTCAVKTDGSVFCWGNNSNGQLGDATSDCGATCSMLPVEVVPGIGAATKVSVRGTSSCAQTQNGAVFCWGNNNQGQLGNGTTQAALDPNQVTDLPSTSHLSLGAGHACSVSTGETLWCWGSNSQKQLATEQAEDICENNIDCSKTALQTTALSPVRWVTSGFFFTCVIDGFGALWCWGENSNGQLGKGDKITPSPTPTRVLEPVL